MPNGTKPEGVKAAGNEYNAHRGDYPFQVYINWGGSGQGNILFNDKKFVSLFHRVYLNKKLLHDIVKYTRYSVLFKHTTTIYSSAFNIVSYLQATSSRFKRQISDKF